MKMWRAVIPIMLVMLLSTLGLGTTEVAGLQDNGAGMVTLSLDVQKNGWAQAEFKWLVNKQAIAELEWGLSLEEVDEWLDDTKKEFEKLGWRVTSYSEGRLVGLRMTKQVSLVKVKDLFQILDPDSSPDQEGPLLVIDREFFYTRYRLATDLDLGSASEEPQPTFQLRVTLPGKVARHNADQKEGKTLIWYLGGGQDHRIEAEARAVNAGAVVPLALIIAGIIGGISYAVLRRRKTTSLATVSGARFCSQCGKPLDSDAAFCSQCGAKV